MENAMNKYDLIRRLRKECGVTEEEMKKFVKAMLDTFTEALTEGDRVFLPGLGTLTPVPRAGRMHYPGAHNGQVRSGEAAQGCVEQVDMLYW